MRPLLLLLAACGLLGGTPDAPLVTIDCRPLGTPPPRVAPWPVGSTTPSGWTATAIAADHAEFARVAFRKNGAATTLEIKYQDAEPGDWATRHYQLMPAPGETPPQELLLDAMAALREADVLGGGPIGATAEDPYAGLPPCSPR